MYTNHKAEMRVNLFSLMNRLSFRTLKSEGIENRHTDTDEIRPIGLLFIIWTSDITFRRIAYEKPTPPSLQSQSSNTPSFYTRTVSDAV